MTAIHFDVLLIYLRAWAALALAYATERLRERSTAVATAGFLATVIGVQISPDLIYFALTALAGVAIVPDGKIMSVPTVPADQQHPG